MVIFKFFYFFVEIFKNKNISEVFDESKPRENLELELSGIDNGNQIISIDEMLGKKQRLADILEI